MNKKQKVKFRKGDRKPRADSTYPKLNYRKRMIKRNKEILWKVTEYPTKTVVGEFFFEEDANKLCDFQNKHQVWKYNGGVMKFLCVTDETL